MYSLYSSIHIRHLCYSKYYSLIYSRLSVWTFIIAANSLLWNLFYYRFLLNFEENFNNHYSNLELDRN